MTFTIDAPDRPSTLQPALVVPGLAGVALESTVRYLGIEVDDALQMSEQEEI